MPTAHIHDNDNNDTLNVKQIPSLATASVKRPKASEWLLFCGGSGSHGILTELIRKAVFLSQQQDDAVKTVRCVIPITDNGGSSQDLIDYFGGPAVGDCRNMLLHCAGVVTEELSIAVKRVAEGASGRREAPEDASLPPSSHAPSPSAVSSSPFSLLLEHVAELTTALKVREPNRESLKTRFEGLMEAKQGEEGDSSDGKDEDDDDDHEEKAQFYDNEQHKNTTDNVVEKSIRQSRRAIRSAMRCYEQWERGISDFEEADDDGDEVSQCANNSQFENNEKSDKEVSEFVLPPSISDVDGGGSSNKNRRRITREPVNYVGASTGNVLLFALFLEQISKRRNDDLSRGECDAHAHAIVADEGALETACRIFWHDILCIPFLLHLYSSETRSVATRSAACPKENSPHLNLVIVPSIDFYDRPQRCFSNIETDAEERRDDAGERKADVFDNTAAARGNHEVIKAFRAQQRPRLSTLIHVPQSTVPVSSSSPSSLLLKPLPFARLDTLLADGKVVEGQKEFSYGLGPTPHGTPLSSRSASVGSAHHQSQQLRFQSPLKGTDGSSARNKGIGGFGGGVGTPRSGPNPNVSSGAAMFLSAQLCDAPRGGGGKRSKPASPAFSSARRPLLPTPPPAPLPSVPTTPQQNQQRRQQEGERVLAMANTPATPFLLALPPAEGAAAGDCDALRFALQPDAPATSTTVPPPTLSVSNNDSFASSVTSIASGSGGGKNAVNKNDAAAQGLDEEGGGAGRRLASSLAPLCVDYSIQCVSVGGAVPLPSASPSSSAPSLTPCCLVEGCVEKEIFVEPSRTLLTILSDADDDSNIKWANNNSPADAAVAYVKKAHTSCDSHLHHHHRLHIIFSRGSFFTSLGAACVPVASALKALLLSHCSVLGNPHEGDAATTMANVGAGNNLGSKVTVSFSFILNGTVDRETRMFFANASGGSTAAQSGSRGRGLASSSSSSSSPASSPKKGGSVAKEEKEEVPTPALPAPDSDLSATDAVSMAVRGFLSAVLGMSEEACRQVTNAIRGRNGVADGDGKGQMMRRAEASVQLFGLRSSKWAENFDQRKSLSSLRPSISVRWLTPKVSAFSSNVASTALAAENAYNASMYNDEVLVSELLSANR